MMKKTALLVFLVLFALGGSGCWDMVDIDKKSFILTLGFDTPNSQGNPLEIEHPENTAPPKIHVSMEVFSPYLARRSEKRSTIVLRQDAPVSLEAVKLAQAQSPRRLSLVHLRAVVIGEDLAKQGIKNILNDLKRNPSIANRFRLIFTHDYRAEDLLEADVETETNAAEVITKLGELDMAYAFHRTIDFNVLYEELIVNKGTSYAPHYDLNERGRLSKIGAVVLKNWRMTGILDAYEVRGVNWITGKVEEASVTASYENMLAVYRVRKANSKIIPSFSQGQPSFQVLIKTDGALTSLENEPPGGIDGALHEKLEATLAQAIKKEIEDAVALSQKKHQADYLGLGQKFYNKYPRIYKALDWEALYPNIPVQVEVQTSITRTGSKR